MVGSLRFFAPFFSPSEKEAQKESNQLVDLAIYKYNNRNVSTSLELLTQAIYLDDANIRAYFNRGTILLRERQYVDALSDFNQAIQVNPSKDNYYNNRGIVHLYLYLYQKSIRDFSTAIILNPNFDGYYINRSISYRRIDNLNQAVDDLHQALIINPNSSSAYEGLGDIYFHLKLYENANSYYLQSARYSTSSFRVYIKILINFSVYVLS
jgi:tetratricopeptide (TPR) repeat protein